MSDLVASSELWAAPDNILPARLHVIVISSPQTWNKNHRNEKTWISLPREKTL